MRRIIFVDTNWILGGGNDVHGWKIDDPFPSNEFNNLLENASELDLILITPTVFDELIAKVGLQKVNELKNMNFEIVERIVGFPYEVFTRIKNRQPQFFRNLSLKKKIGNPSYMMSNDFLILHEAAAILYDQIGNFGICEAFFLTRDSKFKEMFDKLELKFNFETPTTNKTEWIPSNFPKNHKLILKPFLENESIWNEKYGIKMNVENFELRDVLINSINQNEYKLKIYLPLKGNETCSIIVDTLLVINKNKAFICSILSGRNYSSYHLLDETKILKILKTMLREVYKYEDDWWMNVYMLNS